MRSPVVALRISTVAPGRASDGEETSAISVGRAAAARKERDAARRQRQLERARRIRHLGLFDVPIDAEGSADAGGFAASFEQSLGSTHS